MTKGPYIYDPAQKEFVRRGNSNAVPTPVEPAAAAAGLAGAARGEGSSRSTARWYWVASVVLLALWLVMLLIWQKQTTKYVPQGPVIMAPSAAAATNAAARP